MSFPSSACGSARRAGRSSGKSWCGWRALCRWRRSPRSRTRSPRRCGRGRPRPNSSSRRSRRSSTTRPCSSGSAHRGEAAGPRHHVMVQEVAGRLSVSLDLEVDGRMSLGAAHGIATKMEAAIREDLGPEIEVDTHIEPLRVGALAGTDESSDVAARLGPLPQRRGPASDTSPTSIRCRPPHQRRARGELSLPVRPEPHGSQRACARRRAGAPLPDRPPGGPARDRPCGAGAAQWLRRSRCAIAEQPRHRPVGPLALSYRPLVCGRPYLAT